MGFSNYQVAVVEWSKQDGIAAAIDDELRRLQATSCVFPADEAIPAWANVVFSFGPYGRFLPLARRVAAIPADRRPVFVHWNTEGIPDLRLSWSVMKALSMARSWFGRRFESGNRLSHLQGRYPFFTWEERRALRFRYMGDYYYAHQKGWLSVFADSSALYADLHRRHNLPTVFAPWGASPTWYQEMDLERDIDVLWMGGWGTRRRQQLFNRLRAELDPHGVRFHVADNIQNPFIFNDTRTRFLNRAKITLNLTRTWYDDNFSRFALAIPNRSLVVSEPLLAHCPAYNPGVHYVSAPIEQLAETILYYLDHEEERARIVDNGYQLVTTELRFDRSIQAILEAVDKNQKAAGYDRPAHYHSVNYHRGEIVDNTFEPTIKSSHPSGTNSTNATRPPDMASDSTLVAIREYWNSRPLGVQYRSDHNLEVGSAEFFAHIRPWMTPYKFPWIMERIEREAALLKGKNLLEVGCGMGFDSLEFLRRGVRVTATDLTPNAVQLASRHFELEGVQPEAVHTASALELPFPDHTFDAVWADGVLHVTGNTAQAIAEVRRVLVPGGRAIISHFYRKPSWMYWLHRWGKENIEHKEEDPPVNEFLTEKEILAMFTGFEVVEAVQEHERALLVRRDGLKAALYTYGFMPLYNCLPQAFARRLAYKFSVTAVKI